MPGNSLGAEHRFSLRIFSFINSLLFQLVGGTLRLENNSKTNLIAKVTNSSILVKYEAHLFLWDIGLDFSVTLNWNSVGHGKYFNSRLYPSE